MTDIEKETELYKSHPEELYTKSFFCKMQRIRPWQNAVGKIIVDNFKINSAIDFGCGLGYYLEGMQQAGCKNLVGLEYMYEYAVLYLSDNIKSNIFKQDIMESVSLGKFDLSMSIEVAEHLLPEKSDIFIDNLVNSSNKYIFFTAAPKGQGGTGHINERPKEFWIEKLNARGFNFSEEDTKLLKLNISKINFKSKYFNLMKHQFMLFRKK